MGEREKNISRQPEPENGDKERELNWVEENRAFLYAISTTVAAQVGRGALFVDTTTQLPGRGHPLSYRVEGEIEPDEMLQNLLQEYDPHREFIVTLLKADGQASTYLGKAPEEMGWWDAMATPTAVEEQERGKLTEIPKALFDLGQIVVTRGAAEETKNIGRHPIQLIAKHVEGEWGDLPPEDIQENELSLEKGYRLFSAYNIEGAKFYVITEWDRSYTTALLPSEY